nr:MAG TPA: hypothetical protein [Bacteriophage sp.]
MEHCFGLLQQPVRPAYLQSNLPFSNFGLISSKELADIFLKSTEYILFCLSQKPLYSKLSPPYRRVYHRKENNERITNIKHENTH